MTVDINKPTGMSTATTCLKYKEGDMADFVTIEGLLEVPELGGTPEQLDTTTLSDKIKKSIPGIIDLGDLAFKFLYDNSKENSNYRVLKKLQNDNTKAAFQVVYPDGTAHEFTALVSVKMDSVTNNAVITCTASFSLQSEIGITDPKS